MKSLGSSAGKQVRVRHRIAVKSGNLETELRQKILSGGLAVGNRLPVRRELAASFGISPNTVQRALNQLTRDGFVVAQGRRGTFVADRPPHMHRYGLVTPGPEGGPRAFDRLLIHQATEMEEQGLCDFRFHKGVYLHPETEAHQKLLADVRAQRVAGLILTLPWSVTPLPVREAWLKANLPVVGIGDRPETEEILALFLNTRAMIARALDEFVAQGRRRVAVLTLGAGEPEGIAPLKAELAARSLETRPYWLLGVHPGGARSARQIMHLLMKAQDRPDALLITDDNLVEPATAGLLDSRARVPEELLVIGHCNFPHATPSHVPIRRIGFDLREVLRMAVELIDRRRRGESVAAVTEVPPVFDDQVRETSATTGRGAAPIR